MWNDFINIERKKPYFQELELFINEAYKTKTVYPQYEDIYKAFLFCPFSETKVVILGQDPYHNKGQANGLAFSVKKGSKIPPSLRNIYKEIQDDLGIAIPSHGDLSSWAKQGILLLNTILTVEAHTPLSHANKGWEIFTDNVIKKLNEDDTPKVFVLWGNNAKKKEILITNPHHLVLFTSHPSPLSARHSFLGSKLFSKINDFLYNEHRRIIDYKIK